ncbi:hypothetical protein THAOC_24681 [Thalassiosira oceanica]|uniref:Uncharacterized protein n=1 Tax=Thalassiosira oceanica TaxID=159749 RepID=K0S9Y6_THAOC|nr:hypothetical protein THAOC_24681 [Thalassiosira oceanica]|eukprot:EJK55577.1 hypothetical protein THAOC_24681 [Thalassiosira oceanica]
MWGWRRVYGQHAPLEGVAWVVPVRILEGVAWVGPVHLHWIKTPSEPPPDPEGPEIDKNPREDGKDSHPHLSPADYGGGGGGTRDILQWPGRNAPVAGGDRWRQTKEAKKFSRSCGTL